MRKREGRRSFKRAARGVDEFTIGGRSGARRRARRKRLLDRAAVAALCVVMLVSLVMIVRIVSRSIRTKQLNAALSERHAQQSMQTEAPAGALSYAAEETPQAASTPAPSASPPPGPVVQTTAYHRDGGTALARMEALYEENRDLIGWIEIPQVLDLPVVYRDNSYYLTRDFYKRKNASGTIFLDENHKFKAATQNLLLHGHNMKDGTMFGHLVRYLQDIDYMKRNAFVRYDTLWEEQEYVVFAVLRVSLDVKDERFFNYFTHPTFDSDEAFYAYVRQLQLRSEYAIPLDVEPQDALLTLSTCIDEDRLVIVCRRVREGESRSGLRRLVNLAVRQ